MSATALDNRPNSRPSAAARFALTGTEAAAVARLPQSAMDKLEYLRDQEMRARALASGIYEAFRTNQDNLNDAKRTLAKFDKEWPPATQVVPDESLPLDQFGQRPKKRIEVLRPERAEYAERVERLTAEMKRLQAAQADTNLGFTVAEILDWLTDQPASAKFVAVPSPKITAANLLDALASTRSKADAVREQIDETRSAPATSDELKAQMRAQVVEAAEKGKVELSGGAIRWPREIQVSVNPHTGTSAVADINNAFALTVWLNQDQLIAKLEASIDATADNSRALSAQDRDARLAKLQPSLLALMHTEEAIIVKIGSGVPRLSPLPEVLLGVGIERA